MDVRCFDRDQWSSVICRGMPWQHLNQPCVVERCNERERESSLSGVQDAPIPSTDASFFTRQSFLSYKSMRTVLVCGSHHFVS